MSGCVYTYQPISGLHDPTIVDPQAPNLRDVRLTVHCVPGALVSNQEASVLCQRLQVLFENQGAEVATITTVSPLVQEDLSADSVEPSQEPTTDLFLEIRSRQVSESNDPLLWALSVVTYTLVPAVTGSGFAQDITIRDGSGFLLATDTLEGRLLRRFGAGAWASNQLLNRTIRSEDEKITPESAKEDLSADMYRQLSQLVFNAKVQWRVLQESSPEASWR